MEQTSSLLAYKLFVEQVISHISPCVEKYAARVKQWTEYGREKGKSNVKQRVIDTKKEA